MFYHVTKMSDSRTTSEEPMFTARHVAQLMKQLKIQEPVARGPKKPRTERQIAASERKKKLYQQARELGIGLTKESAGSKTGRSPKTLNEIRSEIIAGGKEPVY